MNKDKKIKIYILHFNEQFVMVHNFPRGKVHRGGGH